MPTWVMWLTLVNLVLLVLLVLLLIGVIIYLIWSSGGPTASAPNVSFAGQNNLADRIEAMEEYLGSNQGPMVTWTGLTGNIARNNYELRDNILPKISCDLHMLRQRDAEISTYINQTLVPLVQGLPPLPGPQPPPVPCPPGGPGTVPSDPPPYPP